MKKRWWFVMILVILIIFSTIVYTYYSNLCNQKVKGEGACEMFIQGYQYDKNSNSCILQGTSGCSAKIPFKTLEECKNICVR